MGFGFRKNFGLGQRVRLKISQRGLSVIDGNSVLRPGIDGVADTTRATHLEAGLHDEPRLSFRRARSSRQQRAEIHDLINETQSEKERNRLEVKEFENRMELLKTVHMECTEPIDWQAEAVKLPPFEAGLPGPHERGAAIDLDNYEPSSWDRLFRKEDKKRKELERKVVEARHRDQLDLQEWQDRTELAKRVLTGDLQAYTEVVRREAPFEEIIDLGSSLTLAMGTDRTEVVLHVPFEKVVPDTEKRLTAKGNVSMNEMTQTLKNHIYQDFVCSCVLRIARELFALIPMEQVLIHVEEEFLAQGTGRKMKETILSVRITRSELAPIPLESVDCLDGIASFPHQMNFLETRGFQPVNRLDFDQLNGGAKPAL
ncbi:hypothetical protein JOD24_001554 [Kroppenstedtia sanguinis]|uniref:DUF4236 domain-containing protein n=1 Tax=Kroppenstedtia sanguinis TaxID=1380684 RepID=A0ABW4C8K8_9BACL